MDSDDKSNRDFFRFWKPRGLHSIVMIHRIYRPESMGDSAGSEVTNHSTPPEVFWLQIIKWYNSHKRLANLQKMMKLEKIANLQSELIFLVKQSIGLGRGDLFGWCSRAPGAEQWIWILRLVAHMSF